MKTLKLIIFVEALMLVVAGCLHAIYELYLHQNFPLYIYPAVGLLLVVCVLFVKFVLCPIGDRFLD